MGLLQPMGHGQGFLKAGFLGFAKSGKTYTATSLAIGTRDYFRVDGPIAFFDTEGGSEYVAARVRRETGKDLIGVRSRSFDDLMATAAECGAAGVSALIVDSITHVWRELCDAYLVELNRRLERAGKKRRYSLEFQDWNPIKAKWGKWTDWYLNSKTHVIICGRAGFEYANEINEETNKRELVKTGTKMKVESEFGFEPSLLVEMEREWTNREGRSVQVNRATVLGDRFAALTGESCDDPTFAFFQPHIAGLVPGAHAPIDTDTKSALDIDDQGNDEWHREKRQRTILVEEVQGEMLRAWPGQTAGEKKAKADLLEEVFKTRSWTAVEGMSADRLRAAIPLVRERTKAAAEKRSGGDSPNEAG